MVETARHNQDEKLVVPPVVSRISLKGTLVWDDKSLLVCELLRNSMHMPRMVFPGLPSMLEMLRSASCGYCHLGP